MPLQQEKKKKNQLQTKMATMQTKKLSANEKEILEIITAISDHIKKVAVYKRKLEWK